MIELASDVRDGCELKGFSLNYLNQLLLLLHGVLSSERGVRLAIAMALHPRLGAASGISVLGGDLLPLCVHTVVREPIHSWHELL